MSPAETRPAARAAGAKSVPTTVMPTTRVTVAFPFSTIKIQEPDARMRALAQLVSELAAHLEKLEPNAGTHDLQERAHALTAELAG